MGRPKKEIDWNIANGAAEIFCTGEEIAALLRMNYDTLKKHVEEEHGISFSEWIEQKRGVGKESLRRVQYKRAMSGNVVMLIWLGKQYLDQKDKQEIGSDPTRPLIIKSTIPGIE